MKRKLQKEWLRSYLWSGPSLLLIALVVVFPILYTFYISLTNMNVYHWFDFTIIGLENYIRALFVFDSGLLLRRYSPKRLAANRFWKRFYLLTYTGI